MSSHHMASPSEKTNGLPSIEPSDEEYTLFWEDTVADDPFFQQFVSHRDLTTTTASKGDGGAEQQHESFFPSRIEMSASSLVSGIDDETNQTTAKEGPLKANDGEDGLKVDSTVADQIKKGQAKFDLNDFNMSDKPLALNSRPRCLAQRHSR